MGIEIYIWKKYVGALVKTPQGIAFQYNPEFKKSRLNISPFNLPLEGKDVYINETDWKDTEGIPGFIYDSLPDRFGTNLLRTYFTDKGLTEKDIDVFTKLQYIGSRGMGGCHRTFSEPWHSGLPSPVRAAFNTPTWPHATSWVPAPRTS